MKAIVYMPPLSTSLDYHAGEWVADTAENRAEAQRRKESHDAVETENERTLSLKRHYNQSGSTYKGS